LRSESLTFDKSLANGYATSEKNRWLHILVYIYISYLFPVVLLRPVGMGHEVFDDLSFEVWMRPLPTVWGGERSRSNPSLIVSGRVSGLRWMV
jgi:hypothetical protein